MIGPRQSAYGCAYACAYDDPVFFCLHMCLCLGQKLMLVNIHFYHIWKP